MPPRTLFEKVWDSHVVAAPEGQPAVLYIDLHLVHEVTSPQAFDGLRVSGRTVRQPLRTVATVDHNIPTTPRGSPITDPIAAKQIEALEKNCREFGVPLFDMDSAEQGIVHVIGPELGITLPGMTIVCGDSHTSTHGAFGSLAFGIGTSEVEHVLATQCLPQKKPKTMQIHVSGKLAEGVTAKDLALGIIGRIGTDGAAGSNNDLNLFEEMDLAVKLQNVTSLNPQALSAAAAMEMATLGGARVLGFEEKPEHPKESLVHPGKVNASMGVYLFNRQLLLPMLIADAENPSSSHDFGKDIIPRIIEKYRVFAYNFLDENKKDMSYWRDVGTIAAYHEANMDLVSVSPIFNLYDKTWPLHTWQQQYPPAKFVFADPERKGVALDSIVGAGSIISGGRVEKSVLGLDVRVNSYSEVDDSIIFNHVIIGRHSRIRRAIIDRHVNLPEGTVIGYDLEADRARYSVTENGIVVVVRPESMLEEPE